MTRKDYAFLFMLIIVYSVIAFARLGDMQAPQTAWTPEVGQAAIIDLGEVRQINTFMYRPSAVHGEVFTLESSIDGHQWHEVMHVEICFQTVFAWVLAPTHFEARYVQIRSMGPRMRIQEVAFRGEHGELIPIYGVSPGGEALVDEQHLVPEYRSFMNSAYFDEVYHPRAAYEMIHGITPWENTHPPLGKNFIALSIRAFGMTPFGWRFAGTLTGVLMVPLLYAFARFLLKSNNWALFAATLFTFDFMHFAQTRLATIDSYVTFFIIGMYFFMYLFVHGVEQDSLRRKLVILGLCGACVGLAMASKWQGVYAVLGLPIVFFPALYRLYLRDRKQATTVFYSCFAFFIALPLVIYVLSFIPYAATYFDGRSFLRVVWDNQLDMYNYHANLVAEHGWSSVWWEWPLNLRPIWIYSAQNITDPAMGASISSFGNPAVWWVGIAATIYIIICFIYKKTRDDIIYVFTGPGTWERRWRSSRHLQKADRRDIIFLLVAYGAQYLPWMFIGRLTWIYHYFPSVPFVVLIISWVFRHHIKKAWWAIGYAALVVALFALFYPILSGLPISREFVHNFLQWLPRWGLIG